MDHRDSDVLDLRDYLTVLRRQHKAILATIAGVFILAMVVTLLQTTTYEASVKIAVEPPSEGTDLERILFGAVALGTQQEILTSTALIRGVLETHGLPAEESDINDFLADSVTAETVTDTTVLQVTVSATEPRLAASLAQSMAESYLAYLERDAEERTLEATADLDTAEETTRQELRSVEQQIAAGAGSTQESLEEERDQLYARLRWIATRRVELETANAFMRRGDIIQPAIVPDEPASPKPLRNGVLALVIGAMLGVGAAFLRDYVDDRVRDRFSLDRIGAGPLLGMVPLSKPSPEPVLLTEPDGAASDAYRRFRTTVLAQSRSSELAGLRIVMAPVRTGANAGAVAANLALALAGAGRRVALLDMDLTRESASALLGTTGPGLAKLLSGHAAIGDVVPEGVPNLWVIPAPTTRGGTREQLTSFRLAALLEEISVQVDDVVVVAPAVEATSDALDIAAQGCAVVLVAQPGITTLSNLRGAVEQFEQVGAVYLGAVLADVSEAPGDTSSPRGRAQHSGIERDGLTAEDQTTSVH